MTETSPTPPVASVLAVVGYALLLLVAVTSCDASLGLTAVLAFIPSVCLGVAVASRGSRSAGGVRIGLAILVVAVVTPVAILVAGLVMLAHCPLLML